MKKIIISKRGTPHWWAWFDDEPFESLHNAAIGTTPHAAMEFLCELHNVNALDCRVHVQHTKKYLKAESDKKYVMNEYEYFVKTHRKLTVTFEDA